MDLLVSLLSIAFAMILFLVPHMIRKPMKNFYILRGVPGTGKSTLAAKMAADANTTYTETDQFMTEPDGTYLWSEDRLSRAIDLNYDAIYLKIKKGDPVVITTGVYARWRAMRDYVDLAKENGYNIHIIECKGNFESVHGVLPERMETFRARFIPNSGLPQMQGITYSLYCP